MAWADLFTGVALVFVIEGGLLFASPSMLRRTYALVSQLPESQLRIGGLAAMLAGVGLLYWVRFW